MLFNDILRKPYESTWKWSVTENGNLGFSSENGRKSCLIEIGRSGRPMSAPVTISISENGKTNITRCTLAELLARRLRDFPQLSPLDRKMAREFSVGFDERLIAMQALYAGQSRAVPGMMIGPRA